MNGRPPFAPTPQAIHEPTDVAERAGHHRREQAHLVLGDEVAREELDDLAGHGDARALQRHQDEHGRRAELADRLRHPVDDGLQDRSGHHRLRPVYGQPPGDGASPGHRHLPDRPATGSGTGAPGRWHLVASGAARAAPPAAVSFGGHEGLEDATEHLRLRGAAWRRWPHRRRRRRRTTSRRGSRAARAHRAGDPEPLHARYRAGARGRHGRVDGRRHGAAHRHVPQGPQLRRERLRRARPRRAGSTPRSWTRRASRSPTAARPKLVYNAGILPPDRRHRRRGRRRSCRAPASSARSSGARRPASRFPKAGVYRYNCLLHPGMKGTVVVKPKGAAIPSPEAVTKRAERIAGEGLEGRREAAEGQAAGEHRRQRAGGGRPERRREPLPAPAGEADGAGGDDRHVPQRLGDRGAQRRASDPRAYIRARLRAEDKFPDKPTDPNQLAGFVTYGTEATGYGSGAAVPLRADRARQRVRVVPGHRQLAPDAVRPHDEDHVHDAGHVHRVLHPALPGHDVDDHGHPVAHGVASRPTSTVRRRPRRALLAALGLALLLFPASGSARTVDVWIAAVPVTWDVVPNGRDAIDGTHVHQAADRLPHGRLPRLHAATGAGRCRTCAHVVADNDGIPGPLIKAQVGDEIRVHFKNLDTEFKRPHSMHFHGVRYAPGSDGAFIPGFSGPRRQRQARPVVHVPPLRRPAERRRLAVSRPQPVHARVDRGRAVRHALDPRQGRGAGPTASSSSPSRRIHGFETINGRAFVGNTPIMRAKVGETVQWDVMTLGDEFHTFHVHGHRWVNPDGTPEDTRTVGPAESFRVRWRRGRARHLALPLPRRGPHGDGHDRPLPGEPAMSAALLAAGALLLAGAHGGGHTPDADRPRRADHRAPAVTMTRQAFLPRDVVALVGEDVTWTNTDSRNHTVTRQRRRRRGDVRLRHAAAGRDLRPRVRRAGHVQLPLHHPPLHDRDGAGVRPRPRRRRRPCCRAGTRASTAAHRPAPRTRCSSTRHDGAFEIVAPVVPAADGTYVVELHVHEPGIYRVRAGELTSPAVQVRLTAAVRTTARRTRRAPCASPRASTPPRAGTGRAPALRARAASTGAAVARAPIEADGTARFTLKTRDEVYLRVVASEPRRRLGGRREPSGARALGGRIARPRPLGALLRRRVRAGVEQEQQGVRVARRGERHGRTSSRSAGPGRRPTPAAPRCRSRGRRPAAVARLQAPARRRRRRAAARPGPARPPARAAAPRARAAAARRDRPAPAAPRARRGPRPRAV